jgi:hypothetical protein
MLFLKNIDMLVATPNLKGNFKYEIFDEHNDASLKKLVINQANGIYI